MELEYFHILNFHFIYKVRGLGDFSERSYPTSVHHEIKFKVPRRFVLTQELRSL